MSLFEKKLYIYIFLLKGFFSSQHQKRISWYFLNKYIPFIYKIRTPYQIWFFNTKIIINCFNFLDKRWSFFVIFFFCYYIYFTVFHARFYIIFKWFSFILSIIKFNHFCLNINIKKELLQRCNAKFNKNGIFIQTEYPFTWICYSQNRLSSLILVFHFYSDIS